MTTDTGREPEPAAGPGDRRDPLMHDQRRARRPHGAGRPLRRVRDGRRLGGVCGGIATFVDGSPTAVRAIWLFSLVPSLGITALAYPVAWLLIPAEPRPAGADDPTGGTATGASRSAS